MYLIVNLTENICNLIRSEIQCNTKFPLFPSLFFFVYQTPPFLEVFMFHVSCFFYSGKDERLSCDVNDMKKDIFAEENSYQGLIFPIAFTCDAALSQ